MNILAIGSHPDDIEFGCGGTLLKYASKGHKISMLVMTEGQSGKNSNLRIREQSESAKKIKAKLYWGGFVDTDIPLHKKTINLIEKVIVKIKPDITFVHFLNDTHQDHRTTAQATITATRYIKNVLFYEVPTTVDFSPASVFTDITDILNKKLELLKTHKSQVFATHIGGLSILDCAKSTAIFRGTLNRVKYAEAFIPLRFSLKI